MFNTNQLGIELEMALRVSSLGLCFFFASAGAMHFITPKFFYLIMPSWFPLQGLAIYASGISHTPPPLFPLVALGCGREGEMGMNE